VRLVIEFRGNGVPQALAQQGAAVAAPSPHIFAHAPRRVGGPADRDTDLSCRAQGRTDHPTARKFDTKRTIRSGGHPRSASRRQIISVGNCPVPDVNRVRDVPPAWRATAQHRSPTSISTVPCASHSGNPPTGPHGRYRPSRQRSECRHRACGLR